MQQIDFKLTPEEIDLLIISLRHYFWNHQDMISKKNEKLIPQLTERLLKELQ